MSKQVRYGLCLLFVVVAAVCLIVGGKAKRPVVQKYATGAVVESELDKTFRVNHGFEGCEFAEASAKYNNYQKFGLKFEVFEDHIRISGKPTKIGTAKAAASYQKDGQTFYAMLTVKIEGIESTIEYVKAVPAGQEIDEYFEVEHGFENCTFEKASQPTDTYKDFGLSFEVTKNGVRLYGMPEQVGTAAATAVYKENGNTVYAVVKVTINGGDISNSYEVAVTANTEVNELIPVAHGIINAVPSEAKDRDNDYADFGLTMNVTMDGIELGGIPQKIGNAHCTAVWEGDGVSFYAELVVHITQGGAENIHKYSAMAGDPFILMLDYAGSGIDPKKYTISRAETYPDTLQSYNLVAEYGADALTIEGVPTQEGTATVTLEYVNENEDSFLTLEINVVTPEMLEISQNAVVDKLVSEIVPLDGEAYTVSQSEDYAGTAKDFGLDISCDGSKVTINGTPNKAGRAYEYFILCRDNIVSRLTVSVNVAQSENSVWMTASTRDGKVILSAQIPEMGTYGMTLYRNTVNSYEGGSAAKGYDDRKSTERSIDIGLNFKRLNAPFYYFYLSCANTEQRYRSNIVRVANPDYVMPQYENPFEDVNRADWYYKDVCSTVGLGLINGKSATIYQPQGSLKICEAIKLAACLNQYYNEGAVTLKSAETGAWYTTYLEYAVEHGIISRSSFLGHYSDDATRGDFAVIFANALPENEYVEKTDLVDDTIPDVQYDESIMAKSVYKLYRAGIVTGSGTSGKEGYFLPGEGIRRSEAAAILMRMIVPAKRAG